MILKIKNGHGYPLIEMNGTNQASFNLENELVRDFLARVTYSESEVKSDTYTKIAPYWLANEESDHSSYGEIESPVIVVGNGQRVVVTPASGSIAAAKTLEVAATTGATLVYNLVPGVTYTWRLYNSKNTLVDSGTFTTTGHLRMIKIAMQNFRDLGGWSCGTGKSVKYGRLYRGMGMLKKSASETWRSIRASIDTDVVNTFKWLGVTLDLDLRNNTKAEPDGAFDPSYPSSSGIRYQYCPLSSYKGVFSSSDTYFSYTKTALESIANELASGGGIYFHCKTGYDRTGTLSAILLALLGVSLSDIVKEYDLSLMNGMKYADKYMGDGKSFGPFMTVLLSHSGATLYDKVYGWLTGTGTWKVGNYTYKELGVSPSVIRTIREQLIEGGDDKTYPESDINPYAFIATHLQPAGASSGNYSDGIRVKGSQYNEFEFAEFSVSAGDVVRIGLNGVNNGNYDNGTNAYYFFTEIPGGILSTVMTKSAGYTTGVIWYDGCYEFQRSAHYNTVSRKKIYYGEYTVKHTGKLTVAIKVDDNTTDSLGGAYVKINGDLK